MGLYFKKNNRANERGFTSIEALVGLLTAMILVTAIVGSYLNASRRSVDNEMEIRAQELARTIIDYISFDLRMAGSGMPVGQAGFTIANAALGDAPLPVLTTSDSDTVVFRMNEKGVDSVLTASFTPAAASRTFTVSSSADLEVEDTLYITNMTQGGTSGLKGIVESVAGNSVTISAGYLATAAAVFPSGSVVSRIIEVTYDSPDDWSGVVRDAGAGPVTLGENSRMSLEYLDANGATLPLPLTSANISNQLSSVRVSVSVRTPKPRANGAVYTANASQMVSLRNLTLMR